MRKIVLAAAAATALFSGAAYANIAHGVQGGVPAPSVLEWGNTSPGGGEVSGQQPVSPEQQNLQGSQPALGNEGNTSPAQQQ